MNIKLPIVGFIFITLLLGCNKSEPIDSPQKESKDERDINSRTADNWTALAN